MIKNLSAVYMGLLVIAVCMVGCHSQVHHPQVPSASVEVVGVIVDDPEGNKDGKVNPGETVKMRFQLKNITKQTIPSGKATLFANQQGIRIIQSTLELPAIKSEEIATLRDAFVVAVSQNVLDNSIAFYLEGSVIRATTPVAIFKRPGIPGAAVEVVNVVINDSRGGNGDGELNPNETVGLRLQLKNTGRVPIPASEGRIFSGQRGINVLDSTAALPRLPVGETISTSEEFTIVVDESATDECATFLLSLYTTNPGELITETTLSVAINYAIYACVDTCAIIPVQAGPDILLIRLSICNRSTSPRPFPESPRPEPLPSVAVKIPANTIRLCITGSPLSPAPTPITDTIFYDTIGLNSCGDPICAVKEFRFSIPDGTLSTPSCLWFTAEIWLNAGTSCVISLPAPPSVLTRTITVYTRI